MEIFGEVGAKMGPRWTQDGPSWQQVAPKMGHDGAKMAILGSVWELFGRSCPILPPDVLKVLNAADNKTMRQNLNRGLPRYYAQ